MDPEVCVELRTSIFSDRLVVMCGAGLSMAPPTSLMSAARLADLTARRYEEVTGEALDPVLHWNLEALASLLMDRNHLREPFISRLVPWDDFRRNPNSGHLAMADFILCQAISLLVSTNYDTHIEDGAAGLGRQHLSPALDGDDAGRAAGQSPYLKLHGCCIADAKNTLWHCRQLTEAAISSRIDRSKTFLASRLRGKDLLLVGFWSDWSYLNEVLGRMVADCDDHEARFVFVVDIAPVEDLERKAPDLYRWATTTQGVRFRHIPVSADEFLNDLRIELGRQFLTGAIARCRPLYENLFGSSPVNEIDVNAFDAEVLYSIRRDLTGRAPSEPVTDKIAPESAGAAVALIQKCVDQGSEWDGRAIRIGDRKARVINTPNQSISSIRARWEKTAGTTSHVDIMVCAGGLADHAAVNIARANEDATYVRPAVADRWLTTEEVRLLVEVTP